MARDTLRAPGSFVSPFYVLAAERLRRKLQQCRRANAESNCFSDSNPGRATAYTQPNRFTNANRFADANSRASADRRQ